MCNQCEKNPVYEFTNKRKLCKTCFVRYFQKKILYAIKKFNLIKREEIIGYKKNNELKTIVLEDILLFASKKIGFNLVKLPSKKADKIAVNSSLDSESDAIMKCLIEGNVSELKKNLPIEGNMIKPLYLFLDKEILLYARIRNLDFRKKEKIEDKIPGFIDDFEKKHPEVKRAIINGFLGLYIPK